MANEIKRCVIISASPENDIDFISSAVNENDYIICADGGYKTACLSGITPDIVIGDFDSCERPSNIEVITLPAEKDYTDTMSAVKLGLDRGYKDFLLLNCLGGRLDHSLNNLYTLNFIHKLGGEAKIEDRHNVVAFLNVGVYTLDNMKGTTVSLFPFPCSSTTLSYEGMKYPLHNYVLTSDEPIAVSNVVVADKAKIRVQSGNALIVISKE